MSNRKLSKLILSRKKNTQATLQIPPQYGTQKNLKLALQALVASRNMNQFQGLNHSQAQLRTIYLLFTSSPGLAW